MSLNKMVNKNYERVNKCLTKHSKGLYCYECLTTSFVVQAAYNYLQNTFLSHLAILKI